MHILKESLLGLVILLLTTTCTSVNHQIEVACDYNAYFNYEIKWEIYPTPTEEGEVRIYTSRNPNHFNTQRPPVAIEKTSKGYTTVVSTNNQKRNYFLLQFSSGEERVVACRNTPLNYVQNFRDMGGYLAHNKHFTRWGILFRSGTLDKLDKVSLNRVRSMHIKTILEFNPEGSPIQMSSQVRPQQHIRIPMNMHIDAPLLERIRREDFTPAEADQFMLNIYTLMAKEGTPQLQQIFNILLEKNNYPILLSDQYGKDYTGYITALVLYAIGIPEETIVEDYCLSNLFIQKREMRLLDMDSASNQTQEAVTTLLKADERFLRAAFTTLRQEHGTIHNYLEKELGITSEKRTILQEILLQPQLGE